MEEVANIVYLIGQLSYGGSERQLLLLIKNLDRTRFRPSVVCLSDDASLAPAFEALGCPTTILGRPRTGRVSTLVSLLTQLRAVRPTILHSFGFASRLAMLASPIASCKLRVSSVRTDPNCESTFGKLLDRASFRSSDAVLVNSHHALAALRGAGLFSESGGRVVYNGLDLEGFDNLRTDLRVGSAGNGDTLPASRKAICTVASLRAVKDVSNLLEAFAIINAADSEVELWIVGDGPLKSDLQATAERLGIDQRVKFLGLRSDIPSVLRAATIGVNSSRFEGLNNAIIEYMAARLPVVATNVGGNGELVVDGETGLLVPAKNPAKLAEALSYLLQNPAVSTRFGEKGRERIEELFRVERMVAETQAVYEELLERKGSALNSARAATVSPQSNF